MSRFDIILSAQEIAALMRRMDHNKDGRLDVKELEDNITGK